ncbi:MAG: tetratricopeptide repeat protein, partial [Myxococcota bacterium]
EEGQERLRPLVSHPELERIELDRLTEAGIHAMVRGMLAMNSPPEAFVRFLVQESEGIPFFVAEYLRTALAEGLLFRDEQGQWHLVEDRRAMTQLRFDQTLTLPVSLRSLFERRLHDLSSEAMELLELAAVIGRDIPESLLLTDLSGLERDLVGDALGELLERRIVIEHSAERLRFVHDKFREVVYVKMADHRRQVLHRRVAEALSAEPERVEQRAALAEHWERGGVPHQAQEIYFEAARDAITRLAYAEAEALLHKGLRLATDPPTREIIRARSRLAGEVLALQGRNADAIAEYHQALSDARGIQDRASEALILQRLSRVLRQLGRIDEAETVCRQGLELHRELGSFGLEGEGLGHLADIQWLKGDMEEAQRLYEQALTIHRQVGNRLYEGQTLGDLARFHRQQGRLDTAQTLYETALELVRSLGQRRSEGQLLGHLGELAGFRQELDGAVALAEQALVLHRQVGDRRLEALELAQLGSVRAMSGALAEALVLTEQALELHKGLRDPHGESRLLLQLAEVQLSQGQLTQAQIHAERALGFLRRLGDRWAQTAALTTLARIEHISGQIEEAWALLEESLALRQQAKDPGALGSILKALGDVHTDQGQLRDARSYYDHALEQFDAFADPAGRWDATLSVARLDRRTGHDPESMDLQLYALDVELGQIGQRQMASLTAAQGHIQGAA